MDLLDLMFFAYHDDMSMLAGEKELKSLFAALWKVLALARDIVNIIPLLGFTWLVQAWQLIWHKACRTGIYTIDHEHVDFKVELDEDEVCQLQKYHNTSQEYDALSFEEAYA